MSEFYHYFVEGNDDKKIVEVLKTNLQLIIPGKVDKFNVVESLLNSRHLMNFKNKKNGTTVILVFDTDTGNVKVLEKNIEFLKKQSIIKEVICITQVDNLEDELIRSCAIKKIKELTNSKSDSDFKRDVLRINNLDQRLKDCKFEMSKFWSTEPKGVYHKVKNEASKIKKK